MQREQSGTAAYIYVSNKIEKQSGVMIFKQIERIQYIDNLIQKRKTGNAKELSNKVGVSRRHIYRIIENLKDLGVPIEFSKIDNSFIYEKPCRIDIKFQVKFLTEDECLDINGGIYNLCYFLSQKPSIFVLANRI